MRVFWTQVQALSLCRKIEAICPAYGCHVALTGGLLYKDGERKDADILFYRIRQVPEIDVDGLFLALATIGLERTGGFDWCIKADFEGRNIDCFFPEAAGDEYPEAEPNNDESPWDVRAENARIDAMFAPLSDDVELEL